jgi:hypothetical protein
MIIPSGATARKLRSPSRTNMAWYRPCSHRSPPPLAITALLLATFTSNGCLAAKNPLIGTWKWDNAKTLQEFQSPTDGSAELKASAATTKAFVEAVAEKLNSNVTLTYTDSKCTEIIFDSKGHELSKESFPYKIVELSDSHIVIDEVSGLSKIFFEGNHFYVKVKVGDYTYKDYFTKSQ